MCTKVDSIGNNSMYILNNVYLERWFSNKHISWKEVWIFLCKHTSIDLCTYLGFGFLEAPREHVLHGPPSGTILTPSLSPFRGTQARSHAPPEEVVYSINNSCSHFTQCLFPPTVPCKHILAILLYTATHAYVLYITFAHLIFYYIILYDAPVSILHLHFFCSSWQAGCPRFTTSDTVTLWAAIEQNPEGPVALPQEQLLILACKLIDRFAWVKFS
jgi:hypothetical protein